MGNGPQYLHLLRSWWFLKKDARDTWEILGNKKGFTHIFRN